MIKKIKNYQIPPPRDSGQAALVAVVMFLFISLLVAVGVTSPVTREAGIASQLKISKSSFLTAEALEEDVVYRIKQAMMVDDQEVLNLNEAWATTTITDEAETGIKTVQTTAENRSAFRKKLIQLTQSDEVSFNYGVQAGNGGFFLKNSSSVEGNIYSNGAVDGFNKNLVKGTVVSAEAAGLVDEVHSTSTVRAHKIQNSTVDGDAYYQIISNTTVGGTPYPDSPDPSPQSFPISDEQIDQWQEGAEAGGVINSPCPFVINSSVTIGPVKINCDLEIKGSQTVVTLAGMIWVVGDITITNAAKIKLDLNLGNRSVAMIANNPANQANSSIVTLRNSMVFEANGPGTYIMVISRNRNAEDGGNTFGIDFQQTATGDALLYSNHGGILITNNSRLEQVTGYKIETRNNATLIYEKGLENAWFDAGPGGSWGIWEWQEIE